VIDRSDLEGVERTYAVVSTKLLAGRTVVRVYSDTPPAGDWHVVEADLEDVYFSTMTGHHRVLEAARPESSPRRESQLAAVVQ